MSLTVQLKSIVDPRIAFEVSLELPPKPTDANETNSKWWVTSYGNLTFGKGTCLASKLKHAYEDALFLVHRMPPTIQSNGRGEGRARVRDPPVGLLRVRRRDP